MHYRRINFIIFEVYSVNELPVWRRIWSAGGRPLRRFYNPAGLSLAADNYLSLSASNYQEVTLSYENVFGPGQDYDRISRTYVPNFVGASKRFSKDLTVAFTILTPETTAFDQTNFTLSPLISNGIDSTRIDYTQDSLLVLTGPSAAYMLSPKLSVGASLIIFMIRIV